MLAKPWEIEPSVCSGPLSVSVGWPVLSSHTEHLSWPWHDGWMVNAPFGLKSAWFSLGNLIWGKLEPARVFHKNLGVWECMKTWGLQLFSVEAAHQNQSLNITGSPKFSHSLPYSYKVLSHWLSPCQAWLLRPLSWWLFVTPSWFVNGCVSMSIYIYICCKVKSWSKIWGFIS